MNKNDYIIRLETEKDYREVENLAREAFWNLSVPGCYEHYFIHVIRKHKGLFRLLMLLRSAENYWLYYVY